MPVLDAPEVFAATEIVTVPLPVPVAPEVIATQLRVLDAVHAQLLSEAVTVTVPVPAAEVKV